MVQLYLARIEHLNSNINAFLTVTAELALQDARRAERELLRGHRRGPLHGIPIALKDNICTRGIPATAGSAILRDFVPAEDATVVRRLRRAGAVLLGKTNMHEFAYGISSENPHFGAVHNPWALERISGGSSGGSAAAVAAGLCVASVGHRHRGIDPRSRFAVRCGGAQADIWPDQRAWRRAAGAEFGPCGRRSRVARTMRRRVERARRARSARSHELFQGLTETLRLDCEKSRGRCGSGAARALLDAARPRSQKAMRSGGGEFW